MSARYCAAKRESGSFAANEMTEPSRTLSVPAAGVVVSGAGMMDGICALDTRQAEMARRAVAARRRKRFGQTPAGVENSPPHRGLRLRATGSSRH